MAVFSSTQHGRVVRLAQIQPDDVRREGTRNVIGTAALVFADGLFQILRRLADVPQLRSPNRSLTPLPGVTTITCRNSRGSPTLSLSFGFCWSGRPDSNWRPPAPKLSSRYVTTCDELFLSDALSIISG
jgi:hypothetical protein